MSLAQDIRTAYENRARDELERCLKKVEAMERNAPGGYHLLPQTERCTCQHGPTWRMLITGNGEPAVCADCRKPIIITQATGGGIADCVAARAAPAGLDWGQAKTGQLQVVKSTASQVCVSCGLDATPAKR